MGSLYTDCTPRERLRVLIDITHPADVHLFKALIHRLRAEGHQVVVTTRQKDVCIDLLNRLGIEHVCLSRMGRGYVGLASELLVRCLRLLRVGIRTRPHVMIAREAAFIGLPGALLRVPRIMLTDTEHARIQRLLSLPFATYICSGTGYTHDHGRRHVRFRGVPQFAYLDPRYYQPDPAPLREAGVDPKEPYIVLRLVSWGAAHDLGLAGANEETVHDVIGRLARFGRVIISSERPLPSSLRPYANPVSSDHALDLLSFARLFIGEGGTMAAEAAIMGVPSIFTNPLLTGFLAALEREYGLVRNVSTLAEGVQIAEQWMADPNLRQTWSQRRAKMIQQSEDIPGFLYAVVQQAARRNTSRTAHRT